MKHKQPDTVTPPLDSDTVAPPQLNPDDYSHHFADSEMSKEQQKELLETLWHMMGMMARMGYGLDPVQMLFSGTLENSTEKSASMVKQNNPKDMFNNSAQNQKERTDS